jgi:endonuclease/exonuclease/phosphatase family metal-dependent hydrolase
MIISSLLFNVQDFFIFMDKYNNEDINTLTEPKWQLLSTSFYPNKDLAKILEIKKIIQTQSPDIIMLIEVGGSESLHNFNQYFLNNEYKPYISATNSDRGIDFGFLVRNKSKLNVKLNTFTKDRLSNGKKFARGLFELKVVDQENNLKAFFYLTHLKSKLDLRKEDFEGRNQREAEVSFILKHIKQMEVKFPNVPLFICGDLNGIIFKNETEPELVLFQKNSYLDALELLNRNVDERVTYYYFDKNQNRNDMQLDYILINKRYKSIIKNETKVLGFDPQFSPFPPEKIDEKLKMPSDHLPYYLEIEL